ncbi:ankyrin repeat protein [Biomphalaria glabrata]|nr:ankyrin repeat protein [Biomphalaria glabrata]
MEKKLKSTNEKPSKIIEFFTAVQAGNCRKVRKMLKLKDVDINDTNPSECTNTTALIIACQLELFDMVDLLLKTKPKPPNVNSETTTGCRAIWWAVKHGNIQLTKLLLSTNKCEVNFTEKETGYTLLYRAILSNSPAIVKELLHAGANVNTKLHFDSGAVTPLIKAIQMNNLDICQLLINNLCNLHAVIENGCTALHIAVVLRRYEICELLLESGSKVNAKSKAGVTAMTIAIEQHNPYMVRLLLQYGYKMDRQYSWRETPLEQAIRLHSDKCAITLLLWGCKLSKKSRPSYLYMAVSEKLWNVVHFLVELNPMCLQETWLKKKQWPVAVYCDEALRQHILELSTQVFSLKELCRSKVFRCIGRFAPVKLVELPLPAPLIDYMMFREFIKEDFYDKIALEKIICPYDCPVICSQWDCYPLDISVSSDSEEY